MASPILIAGGGIAGLVAALALQRQGRRVIVLEQARAIGDVGAGISMGARTSRALYGLGLEDAIKAVADTPQGSAAFDYRTGQVLGATDRLGGEAVERPVHFQEIFATLYQNLGLDVNTATVSDLSGRPHYITEGRQPIRELIS